jgi:hypothetical protein
MHAMGVAGATQMEQDIQEVLHAYWQLRFTIRHNCEHDPHALSGSHRHSNNTVTSPLKTTAAAINS